MDWWFYVTIGDPDSDDNDVVYRVRAVELTMDGQFALQTRFAERMEDAIKAQYAPEDAPEGAPLVGDVQGEIYRAFVAEVEGFDSIGDVPSTDWALIGAEARDFAAGAMRVRKMKSTPTRPASPTKTHSGATSTD